MEKSQGKVLISIEKADGFFDAYAARLGVLIPAGTRDRLRATLAELMRDAAAQNSEALAARNTAAEVNKLKRRLIRDHMSPIANVALMELAQLPNLVAFKLSRKVPSIPVLVAAANGMADEALRHEAVFIAAGCRRDFVAQLRIATEKLWNTSREVTARRRNVSGARKGVLEKLARGRKAIRALDAFMKSALVNEPELLAAWQHSKRVPTRARSTVPVANVPAPDIAPPVTTSVAAA